MVLIIHTGSAFAQESDDNAASIDKSQYTLFNPTPSNLMREFEPDRPDLTNNPFTANAGHVQLESDLFNYTQSRPDEEGAITEKSLFGSTNIRAGITNDTELQFLLQPFNAVRMRFKMTTWHGGPDVLEITGKSISMATTHSKNPAQQPLASYLSLTSPRCITASVRIMSRGCGHPFRDQADRQGGARTNDGV